jgi:hypothetical protein
VQWVKVNVDARSRDVFSIQAMIVPGNLVAVPEHEGRRAAAPR